MPFYMETSTFQLITALLFAFSAGLIFCQNEHKVIFRLAGLLIFYVALDERYMLHECFKLSTKINLNSYYIGDLIVFILGLLGILSGIFAIVKLSKNKMDKLLYFISIVLCFIIVYLDSVNLGAENIILSLKVEEISELLLAITLIIIALTKYFTWKTIVIGFFSCWLLLYPGQLTKIYIWPYCPKVLLIR